MKTCVIPTVLLIVLAAQTAWADEPSIASSSAPTASPAEQAELPYGAGYEARQRRTRGHDRAAEGDAGARKDARPQAQERDRNESLTTGTEARSSWGAHRCSATRESRREARGQRGHRGPAGS